jgi:hypothetical protein
MNWEKLMRIWGIILIILGMLLILKEFFLSFRYNYFMEFLPLGILGFFWYFLTTMPLIYYCFLKKK